VNGKIANGTGQITVDLPPSTSSTTGPQQVQVHIIAPDLSQQTINLQPTAPARWEGSFPAAQPGAYLFQVTWRGSSNGSHTSTNVLTATSGLVVPYSPEFSTQGTDTHYLTMLAHAGGGILLASNDPASAFTQSLTPISAAIPITFLLLALAALLLPIDIAARRLSSLEFLTVALRWFTAKLGLKNAQLATAGQGEAPVVAPLGKLREQREERRTKVKPVKALGKATAKMKPDKEVPVAPAPKPVAPAEPKVSAAEALLAAKRKRQAGSKQEE
jgi:hypothetical protein